MSNEHDRYSESTLLNKPKFSAQNSDWQYTGKGWRLVDPDAERERLETLQRMLAVRQGELIAGDCDDA